MSDQIKELERNLHKFNYGYHKQLQKRGGLYSFWLRGGCLYVGMSMNLNKRTIVHTRNEANVKLDEYVKAFPDEIMFSYTYVSGTKSKILRLEKKAISKLKPPLNKADNPLERAGLTYPALHGKFGDVEYYLASMQVEDVIERIQFPAGVKGWESKSLEERYQRTINYTRIKNGIAKYFSEASHRFSSAIVLAYTDGKKASFKPITKEHMGSSRAFSEGSIGMLTLSRDSELIPIDGQHRIKAFEIAIEGKLEWGVKPNLRLTKDAIAVILIQFDEKLSRYIFNKINRYAKPTTKADNLITSDDDAVAVITRRMIDDDRLIDQNLVHIGSNSLNRAAREFTTLSTLYDANMELFGIIDSGTTHDPTKIPIPNIDQYKKELMDEWEILFSGIPKWRNAIRSLTDNGDTERRRLRKISLLGRPAGQLAIVKGYTAVRTRHPNSSKKDLARKLNKIKWELSNPQWEQILVNQNGRMMSGKTTVKNASEVIAHMIGAKFNDAEKKDLLARIYGKRSRKKLPDPIK